MDKLVVKGYVVILNKFRENRFYWVYEENRCHKKRSRDALKSFCNCKALINYSLFGPLTVASRRPRRLSIHVHQP